jgi:DNA polymerase
MVAAPAGQTFLQADFSAVEARGVAWISGCALLLQWFREGRAIYEEMAARIVGKEVAAILADSIERQLGKQVVLGGGYGMGGEVRNGQPSKFQQTCEKYGIACTPAMASAAIKTYRETFPEIPQFWKAAEAAAKAAVRNGGSAAVRIEGPGPAVWFKMQGPHLLCKLPSGRKICWPFARLDFKPAPWDVSQSLEVVSFMEENQNHQWVRGDTYGGKLTENIVQALCRDLERDSMARVEAFKTYLSDKIPGFEYEVIALPAGIAAHTGFAFGVQPVLKA